MFTQAAHIIRATSQNSLGTKINDLLGQHGLAGGLIGAQVDALAGNPLGALNNLRDAFLEAAMGRGTNGLERQLLTGGQFPALQLPAPHAALHHLRPQVGHTYHRMDLAPGSRNDWFARAFDPRRRGAAKFERLLKQNPLVRAMFERAIGGRFVPDRKNDGKITIERTHLKFRPVGMPGMHPLAKNAQALLQGMDNAVLGAASGLAGFAGMIGAGLGQVAGGFLGRPSLPGQAPASPQAPAAGGNNEINQILADPSLTIEDKITMMLMAIMKNMDKDIEDQGKRIADLQQQQNKSGSSSQGAGGKGAGGKGGKGGLFGLAGSVAGGAFGGPIGSMIGGQVGQAASGLLGGSSGAAGAANGQSSPSIDVETLKLKRLVEKRGQMFDLLRQIIDKYNETAKGVIQSIG